MYNIRKTNHSILRKFSDGRMDRRIDRQMDKSDFIGRCRTNVEYPVKRSRHRNNFLRNNTKKLKFVIGKGIIVYLFYKNLRVGAIQT